MIEVIFNLREPGNHRRIAQHFLPVVPRENELVFLPDQVGRYVHSVTYMLDSDEPQAVVLLK